MSEVKRCAKCREVKPVSEFFKYGNRGALQSYCKTCQRGLTKAYYATPIGRMRDMLARARRRAEECGADFTLTNADIRIPEHCPICGVALAHGDGSGGRNNSPSLDKYDPLKGYISGNVWVICGKCNTRKQDMSGEGLIELGARIIEAWAA